MDVPGWLLRVWEPVAPYAVKLAVWRGYEQDLQTLAIYGVGIAIFTMLVFGFFCDHLSKRNPRVLFKKAESRFGRFVESIFIFPIVSFLFFTVLASSLFLLAKTQTTYQILLLSMSVVVGVRMTAFVRESAASDLAKLLPLSLLGVLIVDPSYASLDRTWAHFGAVPSQLPVLGRFFLLFMVLEGLMQAVRGVANRLTRRRYAHHLTKADLIENANTRTLDVEDVSTPAPMTEPEYRPKV